ncbi:MAG: glucose 1-dehydrogenase [Hyphomicrobiales bacterium]|nr:glucose 1-dehydrogenase [Hyphomicrobiales bacterium]MDE2016162.1 glucose 1-dehydrogenase [Hyphomicrobiales bacterium]
MSGRLAGRTALVTGGSRGIGAAVACAFAREGARVAVGHWRDADKADAVVAAIAAAGGPPTIAVEADVGSPAEIEAMFGRTLAAFGRLDVLVNNAGFQLPTPGDSFDEATFRRVLDVDLVGAAFCARAAIAHFLSRPGGGAVVNTTSVHELVPKPGYAAYSVAKGGLGALTRTLALEFADRGIRVNSVGPGAVVTDMNAAWTGDPAARAAVEAHIPMGRAAEADEIAPAFVFLASDEARFVTGQTLYVCGGLTLYGDFKRNWAS